MLEVWGEGDVSSLSALLVGDITGDKIELLTNAKTKGNDGKAEKNRLCSLSPLNPNFVH